MIQSKVQPQNLREIVVIGSINTDMVVKVSTLPVPGETVLGGIFSQFAGGKGANQAVAAARLGADVLMVGSLGRDSLGDTALDRLQAEGINCVNVSRDKFTPSGVALINVAESGENQITVAPGANLTLDAKLAERVISDLPAGTIVLLQLEISQTIIETVLKTKKDLRIILDPAPAKVLDKSLLQGLFLMTPNQTEAELLTGVRVSCPDSARSAAKKMLSSGIQNVIVTLGNQGALLANKNSIELIPAPRVTPIDTTAAGDCFNGALATALNTGHALREAVLFACKAASIAVTRSGAQDSMPSSKEPGLDLTTA